MQRYTTAIKDLATGYESNVAIADGANGVSGSDGGGSGGAVVRFWPTEPTCCMIHVHCRGKTLPTNSSFRIRLPESHDI
jgi:hypothetical protein